MEIKTRVLVVEDEWLIAEDHASSLQDAGFEIVGPASSVKMALRLIENEHIDVALLDIGLNGETSYPIADELKARGVPFAFLSGFVDKDVPVHLRECRILAKPAAAASLVELAKELAEKAREAASSDNPPDSPRC